MNQLAPLPFSPLPVPLLVAVAGNQASTRFLEFFTVTHEDEHKVDKRRAPEAAPTRTIRISPSAGRFGALTGSGGARTSARA